MTDNRESLLTEEELAGLLARPAVPEQDQDLLPDPASAAATFDAVSPSTGDSTDRELLVQHYWEQSIVTLQREVAELRARVTDLERQRVGAQEEDKAAAEAHDLTEARMNQGVSIYEKITRIQADHAPSDPTAQKEAGADLPSRVATHRARRGWF